MREGGENGADDAPADGEGPWRMGRRDFLHGSLSTAILGSVVNTAQAAVKNAGTAPGTARRVVLRVNGTDHSVQLEPRVTLLDALREYLHLGGTKKGCDRGQCGACTVLVNGRRINACLTLALMHEGDEIVTIEGLASASGELHPLQQAFIDCDALQCGYCTPGQICSAVGALDELRSNAVSQATPNVRETTIVASSAEICERMSGNLCRCGAYSNIVAAVESVLDTSQRKPIAR